MGEANIAKGCAGLKESIDANTEYHKEIQQQMAENRKGQAVFNNQLAEGLAAAGIDNNLKAEGEGSEAGAGFDYNHSPPPKKWFQPSPGYNPKRFITLKGFISIFH